MMLLLFMACAVKDGADVLRIQKSLQRTCQSSFYGRIDF